MREMTISEALNQALREEMLRDDKVFVIGEDIGHYGGTFDVTKGLLKEFGPERVISTPISENAIIGMAVGAALAGMRPVAEIMFCDFLTCGIDQTINFAAILTYAYGGLVKMPLVIRTTTGHHGGAQHSKSLEAWLTHIPGLKVVMPSTAYDAKGLLKSAIRDENPVVLFESRHLYGQKGLVPEEEYLIPIGQAEVKREGKDLTLLTYGFMMTHTLQAVASLENHGIDPEIVDLRTLSPLDMETIFRSARKTGRVLIIHEAFQNCGLGAEIATRIYSEMYGELKQPIERLAHLDVPHPYSPALEKVVRPNREKIVATVCKMMGIKQPVDVPISITRQP